MADGSTPNSALPATKYFKCSRPRSESPGVIHVEINRPEKMNAFIEPMWIEIGTLFTTLSTDPSVRAIVLSGTHPKAFTAGLDTSAFARNSLFAESPSQTSSASSSSSSQSSPSFSDPARHSQSLRAHISDFQACLSKVATCSKPVISAIHGYCLGLGIDLSLCTDVRICAANTTFAVKEVDLGLAADVGTLSRMPKVVGNGSWVWDVCLSGRHFGAEEAIKNGLVSRIIGASGSGIGVERQSVVKEALDWAELVASKSPVAVAGTKEILKWSWDRSVEDGLQYTSVWNSAMLQSSDVREATLARIQKRKPRFEKL